MFLDAFSFWYNSANGVHRNAKDVNRGPCLYKGVKDVSLES